MASRSVARRNAVEVKLTGLTVAAVTESTRSQAPGSGADDDDRRASQMRKRGSAEREALGKRLRREMDAAEQLTGPQARSGDCR